MFIKKIVKNLLLGILAVGLMIAFINGFVWSRTQGGIYKNHKEVPTAQVALVLGARVKANGQMSDMFRDRVLTAIDLYRNGKVEKILISGDHREKYYDEVNAAKKFLLAEKIPEQVIYLDHAGFDTFDSVYRAKHIFQVESAIIVSQGFHLPRALFVARDVDLAATGLSADRQAYHNVGYSKRREMLAQVKAVYDVIVNSAPMMLGQVIPITGDSKSTWD